MQTELIFVVQDENIYSCNPEELEDRNVCEVDAVKEGSTEDSEVFSGCYRLSLMFLIT